MRKFIVSEMIELPLIQEKGGRRLDTKGARTCFEQHGEYTNAHGCYVFGIRAARGYKPIYVGKAIEQSLGDEALTQDKILKINNALLKNLRGTLVVAFVIPENKPGPCPQKLIEEIEYVLIQYAYQKNRQIENENGIYLCSWCIAGVMNRGQGRPTAESKKFRQLVGINNQKGKKLQVAMKRKQKTAASKGKKDK